MSLHECPGALIFCPRRDPSRVQLRVSSCRSGSPSTPGSSCPSPSPSPSAPSSVRGPTCSAHLRRVPLCSLGGGSQAGCLSLLRPLGPQGLCTRLPRGLGSWGLWRLYCKPLWGHFSDSAPGEGLEKLAPPRALCAQTAGTRPHLSLSPQPPLQRLKPNLLMAALRSPCSADVLPCGH